MADCLSKDMGWTHLCAEAWVGSVVCARKQCGAIATLSMITNRMGNFDVEPNAITAATCNEAQVGLPLFLASCPDLLFSHLIADIFQ